LKENFRKLMEDDIGKWKEESWLGSLDIYRSRCWREN
jgi:hypothetical protein